MNTKPRPSSDHAFLHVILAVCSVALVLIAMGAVSSCSTGSLPLAAQQEVADAEAKIVASQADAEAALHEIEGARAEAASAREDAASAIAAGDRVAASSANARLEAANARMAWLLERLQQAADDAVAATKTRDQALADAARDSASPWIDAISTVLPGLKVPLTGIAALLPLQLLFKRPRQHLVQSAKGAVDALVGRSSVGAVVSRIGKAYGLVHSTVDPVELARLAKWKADEVGPQSQREVAAVLATTTTESPDAVAA